MTPKQRKAYRQAGRKLREQYAGKTPPTGLSRKTLQQTTTAVIAMRGASNTVSKKRRPSMPTMPWDKKD